MHLPYISKYLKSYKMIYYATFDHFKIYAKKKPTNYLVIMLAIKILPIAVYVGSVGRGEMCQRAHSVTATIWFGKCHLGMNCLAPFIGTILIQLVHYVLKTMKTFTSKYNSRSEHNLSCQKNVTNCVIFRHGILVLLSACHLIN